MANINYKKLLKTLTTEQMDEIRKKILKRQTIDEMYKRAYFWTPSPIADVRHNNEKYDTIQFSIGDNTFKFKYSYRETSRFCFFKKTITMNDDTITMRTINTICKYICEALGRTKEEIIEENVKSIDN